MTDNNDDWNIGPGDDDLVAYLGWFLLVSGALLAAVFTGILGAAWLLIP